VTVSFDEATAKALERNYHKRDMVRRRRYVMAALAASVGERILDVAPKGIEQTVPTYVGNQDLVERFRSRF